ncbi:MAG: transposase [Chloroflexota bacterium]
MFKPTIKNNRKLQSQQVLNALIGVVCPYLPLDLQNTRITAEDIIAILGYASANRISADAACHELKEAPSANRLREVLAQSLPDRVTVQCALNRILRAQTPRFVKKGKRSYYIAIDLTLIPYHGKCYEDEKEIVRSQAKSGTTHFHGYATVSIVQDHQRYVLALRFVEKGESMKEIVAWLLDRLKSMGISIRCAYFDKGFCSVPVLKTLKQRKLRFIMPIPVHGKSGGVRTLFEKSASHKTTYTFNSPKHGELEVDAIVVKKYSKGRYKQKGTRWFAYAVARLPKTVEPHQVFDMYRQRFGIETSYRQMNQVRARTTSRNPVIRLLLVGLAFVIFNLYIAIRKHIALCLKNPAKPFSKHWLSLRLLVRMLTHAVEILFDLADVVFRHSHFALS